MWLQRLEEYLRANQVKYQTIAHPLAYTAQEVAASAHIPGKEMAKTVMVKLDGRLAMVVVPASERVHLGRLREATGADEVALASEWEFKDRFPECELGAMPPFGNLYGLDVFVSDTLSEDEEIAFNAGTHSELVRMRYRDFERLVDPRIVHLARH
ncbi:aminoacyl-tRNA deacylase [Rehaibacterium terrae]|uniref:aminoacyl-tRNA deacylase n=1 Tax=Rehaibacterium terrae TaxID=1341696 RepID=UPI003918FCAC